MWTNLESQEIYTSRADAYQVREINAITHIENELIDDACGRVLGWLDDRGLMSNTDVLPLVMVNCRAILVLCSKVLACGCADEVAIYLACWRDRISVCRTPVGHWDQPQLCEIAGIGADYMEGQTLPVSDDTFESRPCTHWWDSEHGPVDMHL